MSLLPFELDDPLMEETVVCMVGGSAASRSFSHWTPAASFPQVLVRINNVSKRCQMFPGHETCPWLATTVTEEMI